MSDLYPLAEVPRLWLEIGIGVVALVLVLVALALGRRDPIRQHEHDLERVAAHLNRWDGGDWFIAGFAWMGVALVVLFVLAWWLS